MRASTASRPASWDVGVVALRVPMPTGREARDGDGGQRWAMRRNCSFAPCQLLAVYLSLCAVSLGIAAAFWLHGATVVLAFAGAELLAVGIALLCYARHAGDRETITLDGARLRVEQVRGHRVERHEFAAAWLRVGAARDRSALVELSADGRRIQVGRHLRPEWRPALAQELRRALAAAPAVQASAT